MCSLDPSGSEDRSGGHLVLNSCAHLVPGSGIDRVDSDTPCYANRSCPHLSSGWCPHPRSDGNPDRRRSCVAASRNRHTNIADDGFLARQHLARQGIDPRHIRHHRRRPGPTVRERTGSRNARRRLASEVNSLGRTIQRWLSQIVAWHQALVTNGPTEAINSLIKRSSGSAMPALSSCRLAHSWPLR